MPDDILKKIDALASANLHDRTAEINSACRFWVGMQENGLKEDNTLKRISELEVDMKNVKEELHQMTARTEQERNLLLKIIENYEHTIKCLLPTPSAEYKASEK